MKPYLVALGLSLVISWILTPAVKKLAFHLGAVDRPNARKVHHRIMPRMGGLAIFIGFMTAALTTLELTTDVIGILLGGAAIAAVGMVDDMIQLSAKVKLVGQIVAALIPVLLVSASSGSITLGVVIFIWIIFPFPLLFLDCQPNQCREPH